MTIGVHAMLYSEDPPLTRAFLRDVLGWGSREHADSGPGWLIFGSGPSETAVHPNQWGSGEQAVTVPLHHEVSLVCDDLAAEMAALAGRGATFGGEPVDRGFGLCVQLVVPAAGEILLYQPSYAPSFDL